MNEQITGETPVPPPQRSGQAMGEVSDGYHTFNELYDHRNALFVALCHAHPFAAFKTLRDDKGEQWDGWFIAGLQTPAGQVTYHMPLEWWDRVKVEELICNEGYDGHTSADVLQRLGSLEVMR
jgi:hypothetical protein